MLKKFFKSVAVLLLMFLLTSSVMASGKMQVALGEKVTLQAEASSAGNSYKWVVKKGREILSTQVGSVFNYTFDFQGEYKVNLTVTDKAGASKNTTVSILVGNRYTTTPVGGTGGTTEEVYDEETGQIITIDAPLRVDLSTLPITTPEKTVHIAGTEGRVVFDITPRADILEYRIDRNIYIDSDGNGVANDDIDNASHNSYLLGGVWQTKYTADESNKIVAEVTVVNQQGKKAKSQVEIIFGGVPAKEGKVVAILDTLPLYNQEENKVYVYGESDLVAFYSRRSQGNIIEYRIDKNIFKDSDGDGNPANDIDNRSDTSFKTGDVWVTEYEKTDKQIIAQLIVVGKGGTGSRIQREIAFSDQPAPTVVETSTGGGSSIRLTADKDFVQKGDPVVFTVEGLMQELESYTFDWDFNGDGEVDQTTEGENSVSYIYDTADIKPVNVKVRDQDGNEASFSIDLLVKDIAVTRADFDYEIDGFTVTFSNLSEVALGLTSKVLDYTWNFGDTDPENYEAQKDQIGIENPVYTYKKPGTYIVSLMVVDVDQVTDTKSEEITIEAPEDYVPEEIAGEETVVTPSEGTEKGGSLLWTIFKVLLYIVLAIVLLIVFIVGGLLVFLKIQHPDLVFEELVDELKIKLLSILGAHEAIEPVPHEGGESTGRKEEVPITPEAPVEEEQEEAPEPSPELEEEPDLSKADAPVPDWMKPHVSTPEEAPAEPSESEVIEGEVEEEEAEPESDEFETEVTTSEETEAEMEPEPEAEPEATEESEVTEEPEPEPEPKATPEPTSEPTPDSETPGEGQNDDLNKEDGPVPDWLKNA